MTLRILALLAACALAAQAQKKIVVFGLSEPALKDLRAAAPAVSIVPAAPAEAADKIAGADGVIGPVPPSALKYARRLQWLQTQSAGVESYAPVLKGSNVSLTNCKIIQGPNIADHAMAMLLMMTRELHRAREAQARQEWARGSFHPIELSGKTAVIIGLGGIGMQIAQRAHAFGMTVIGVDPKAISYVNFVSHVAPPDRLDSVLPQADVLFVSAPSTEKSRGMVGARQFSLLKKGAYFIAVSRGDLYDTPSLVRSLDERRLAGAGLDVTNPEPLPKDHALWKFDNVIITPHYAGQSDVVNQRRMELYKENLRRFAAGEALLNVVDKDKGY
ncbi:MAG: D-2-hydroxyacid dehydrogenase [Bryobacterales bacterium]|nr:D-2-hydroxyacid dehydrogenase [Bryobacterales bacterium]